MHGLSPFTKFSKVHLTNRVVSPLVRPSLLQWKCGIEGGMSSIEGVVLKDAWPLLRGIIQKYFTIISVYLKFGLIGGMACSGRDLIRGELLYRTGGGGKIVYIVLFLYFVNLSRQAFFPYTLKVHVMFVCFRGKSCNSQQYGTLQTGNQSYDKQFPDRASSS